MNSNAEEETDEEIEIIQPNIKIYTFTDSVADKLVKFEVIKFKDSIFIWIGDKLKRNFNDLSLALKSNCAKEQVFTKLMGNPTDLTSSNLASKISKKLGKPVYVSFNLIDDRLTVPVVNNRINEEIRKNPQWF